MHPSLSRLAASATTHCLTGCAIGLGPAMQLALAADPISIAVMEVVDNAVMLLIAGAMDAGLADGRFWGSLVVSLAVAGRRVPGEPLAHRPGPRARGRHRHMGRTDPGA
jgi:hypothetical protein